MTRNVWGFRAFAMALVLAIGATAASAQQRAFRRQIDLSDSFSFSQGSQDIRLEGHLSEGEAGSAVVMADLNGDGRMDVAQAERKSNEVHIFFGRQVLNPADVNPGDPNTAYVVTLNSGVTADRPDVTVFLDPNNNDTSAEFGFSLAAGNVNGDTDPNTGLPLQDLLIGAPFDDGNGNDAGRVFAVLGRPAAAWPASLDAELDGSTLEVGAASNGEDYLFGFSVAAGDFTGDGIDDIAASSRHATLPLYGGSPASFDHGAVHLIVGSGGLGDVDISSGGSVRHITGLNEGDFLGEYLEFCNVTGGSSESLLIGAIGVDNAAAFDTGAMYVYTGATLAGLAGGVGSAGSVLSSDSAISGRDSEDSLGFTVACGDFNGDGRDDPTAGAFFASGIRNQVSGGGEVFVFYGAASVGGPPGSAFPSLIDLQDPNAPFGVRILPSTAGDQLGFGMAYGNMDCDPNGPEDLILGARRYDPQDPNTLAVEVNAGAAFVVKGAVRPPGTLIDLGRGTFDQNNPGQRPGNFPWEPLQGQDSSPVTPPPPPCDPSSPRDPNNPCAVQTVLLGTVDHAQAGYAAAAGDFNGDGCDESAVGAIGDLTRIGGFRGRVYVSAIADNDADQVSDLSDNDDDNDCLRDDDEPDGGVGSPIVTDPLLTDTDGDGVQDGTELGAITGVARRTLIFAGADCSTIDPAAPRCCPDADAGGTTTDPSNPDTDSDTLEEGAEDLDADGAILGDTDGDGTADPGEIFAETDPNDMDTDGDGIDDNLETLGGCPSPLDADSDDDGLPDGCIGACGNPGSGESRNGDAVVDGGETDFCAADSDLDGLQDGTELGVVSPVPGPNTQSDSGAGEDGTDPFAFAPDLDPASTTDPLDTDTDDDCLPDGCIAGPGPCPPVDPNAPVLQGEDVNLNGARDGTVLTGAAGTGASPPAGTETDPNDSDTDNDLLGDGLEWGAGSAACAAMDPNTDPTGNTDADPGTFTDPRDSDTDDGSVEDGTEDQSAGGALNGARDFDPLSFACDPNGNFLLDTGNETDPLDPDDDRGASFSRAPSPGFADPNNTLVQTFIQDDSVVVILLDTDENSDPGAADSVSLDPADLVDPSDPTLVKGFGCIPDDPNTVFNRDVEAVTLTEIDPNTGAAATDTGVFRGIMPLSTLSGGAGVLNLCTEDDRVRFGYGDPDDLCDQRVIVADVTLAQIRSVDPGAGAVETAPVNAVEAVFEQDLTCGSLTTANFALTGTMGPAAADPNAPFTCAPDPNQPGRGDRLARLNFPASLPDDLYTGALDCSAGTGISDRNGFPADCESACVAPPGNPAYCAGAISGDGAAGGTFTFAFTVDNDMSPTVAAVDPADASVVDPNRPGLQEVQATFSEAMDPNSLDPNTISVVGTMMALTPVLDPNTGNLPYDPVGKVLTFRSASGTFADDLYNVTVRDTILDLAGNALDGDADGSAGTDFGSTFVVDYDQVPQAAPVAPLDGAVTGDPNVSVVLSLDQAMEPSTVEDPNNWSVDGTMMAVAAASITYDPVLKRVTFEPAGSLPDDLYTVSFDGAEDHAGNVLDGDGDGMAGGAYTATFIVDADTTPTASANSPAAGSTVMSSVTTIDVAFSEAMDANSIGPSSFTVTGALTGPVTCEFASVPYDPVNKISTCTVVSPSPLPDDDYTVTLASDPNGSGVVDLAGNPLDDDNSPVTPALSTTYTFEVDLAPVVREMSPAPDADVSTGPLTALSVTFDQAVNPARLDPNHVFVDGTSGGRTCDTLASSTDPNTGRTTATCTIAAGFTDDLYTVTLDGSSGTPINDLDAAGKALDGECPGGTDPARCEATEIDPNTGATSGDGTAGGDYGATFLVDTAIPSVVSTDPSDGSLSPTAVSVVTAVFSEAMDGGRLDPGTVQVVEVSDPNNPLVVAGVVTYDPNALEAAFDPNVDLGNGSYEIRLQSSDPNTGVADLGGNLLAGGDFTSSFTVQSTSTLRVQSVAPGIDEVIPGNSVPNNDLDADLDNNLDTGSVNDMTYFMIDSTSVLGDPNTYEPCNASRRGGANRDKIECNAVSNSLDDDRYTVFVKGDVSDPNLRIHAQGDPSNFLDGDRPCTSSCAGVISGDGFNGGDFVYSFFIDADPVPSVVSTVPSAGAIITDPNSAGQVTVTFDQRMDPNTFVPGTTVTLAGSGAGAVTVTVVFDPNTETATITPSSVPLADDDYVLTLFSDPNGDAVRDHSIVDPNTQPLGNPLDGDDDATAGGSFTLPFTVDADQVPQVAAMAPSPESVSGSPLGSVDVAFDQLMDAATLDPNTFTVSGSVIGAVAADSIAFDPNGFTARFNRVAGFIDEIYTVVLDSDGSNVDVADPQGNELDGECLGGADPNSCEATEVDPNIPLLSGDGSTGGTFRAVFTQDADPFPNVASVTPPDSSTSVTPVTSVVLAFDQIMSAATAQDPSNLVITGASDPNTPLACDSGPSASVDPNSLVTVVSCDRAAGFPEDVYTVTVAGDPNAFASPVADLAGNLLDGDADPNTPPGDFSSGFTVDLAPLVAAQAPDPNVPSSDPNVLITVTFDQDMDPNTVTDPNRWTLAGSLGPVAASSITWDPNTLTAAFDPAASLADDTWTVTLDGTLPGAITDATGNALDGDGDGAAGGDFAFPFVMDADPLPVVSAISPPDGSTVGTLLSAVVLTFDQLMDGSTLQDPNNLVIAGASDPNAPLACDGGPAASVDPNGVSQLTCSRAAGFPEDVYTVTLAGDPNSSASPAADVAGNLLDGDDNGAGGDDFTSTFTVDLAPVAVGQAPDPNVPSADPNVVITVTFDQDMDPNSVTDPNRWIVAGTPGTVGPSSITWDPNSLSATFDPSGPLDDDTWMVSLDGTLPGAITDATGNPLDGDGDGTPGGDFVFSFILDADGQPQVNAFTPSLDPNSPAADPNVDIVVTFDQLMVEVQVEDPGNWVLSLASDPNVVLLPASILWDPNALSATFDPLLSLPDDIYELRLTGVSDLAGNPLDGRCPGGICDSPAELPTGDPNQVLLDFVARFEIDAVPATPPPGSEPVLDMSAGGGLTWTPPPVAPGGTTPAYNVYRGDVGRMALTGVYTQDPSAVPEAMVQCSMTESSWDDGFDPGSGRAAFYLVAEVVDGLEGTLGTDSSGQPRPSEGLCGPASSGAAVAGGGGSGGTPALSERTDGGE